VLSIFYVLSIFNVTVLNLNQMIQSEQKCEILGSSRMLMVYTETLRK